jgi:NAD(P)-dependent dehydrogenase (short-subunit alcohol dehydrogenase family)
MAQRSARLLEGQVALVTGGGKGIGRAIALALAARGVRVVVTGRDERALGEAVGEIAHGGGKARHLAGDVRDAAHLEAAVDRAVSTFGALDIAIANAGVSGRVALDAADQSRALTILETNLVGAYSTFSAALRRMKGPGRLIAVSSVLAKFGVPGYAAYCASKAGILGLVRAAAHEAADRQITANAIVPGWVETEMAEAGLREIASGTRKTCDEVKADAVRAFPLGRFIEPAEVAELVVFLCSSAGDAITGQAISICGGSTAFGG